MAHTVCMLDKQGYTYAHARTHRQIYEYTTYCFSTAKTIREHAAVLSYT
jgi:hypothetical protein